MYIYGFKFLKICIYTWYKWYFSESELSIIILCTNPLIIYINMYPCSFQHGKLVQGEDRSIYFIFQRLMLNLITKQWDRDMIYLCNKVNQYLYLHVFNKMYARHIITTNILLFNLKN